MRSLFSTIFPCGFLVLSLASPASADIAGVDILERLRLYGVPTRAELAMGELTPAHLAEIFKIPTLQYLLTGSGESHGLLAKFDAIVDDLAKPPGPNQPQLNAQARAFGSKISLADILEVSVKQLEIRIDTPFTRSPMAKILTHAALGTLPFQGDLILTHVMRLLLLAQTTLADPSRWQAHQLMEWIQIVGAIGQMMSMPQYTERGGQLAAELVHAQAVRILENFLWHLIADIPENKLGGLRGAVTTALRNVQRSRCDYLMAQKAPRTDGVNGGVNPSI